MTASAITALLALAPINADTSSTLAGRVTADGAGIPEVRVVVVELHRTTLTTAEGRYALPRLPAGAYTVSFSAIGYRPEVRRVAIPATGRVTLDVAMSRSLVDLPALQVTASAVATGALDSPQPTAVLEGEALRTAQASSVGETLEGLQGVRSWSTGVGIGKPVIRGLSSNRVLVVADGQRLEYQQWGDEHSPNVETVDAASIEVVRGPASVLYGSDALGGVVNIVSRPIPDALGIRSFARGRLTASYAANTRSPDGTLMLEGAHGGFGWRGTVTGRVSSDVRTPVSVQFNSGNRALSGTLGFGYRGSWGSTTVTVAHRDERIEIHEDPEVDPRFTGYQRLRDDRVRAELAAPVGGGARLEAAVGFERNRRSEYGGAADAEVTTGLLSRALSGDVRLRHAPVGRFGGTLGVQALGVWFDGYGSAPLVPGNTWRSIGLYGFEQATLGRWDLSLGLRADHRLLDAEAGAALGNAASSRSWTAVTGNVGLLHRPADWLAVVFNAGRGFRTPTGPELFANGVHQGVLAYEIGNPALGVETSLNLDAAVRVLTPRLRAEASVFRNAIRNYIYLRSTGEREPASGLPVYRFEQGDARLMGFELSAEARPWGPLSLTSGLDYVRGQNTSTDTPLPWIPPLRASWGARVEGALGRGVRDAYIGVRGEAHPRQSRLDPKDFAPPGYTLVHLDAGVAIPGANRITVDWSLRNALNARYTRFMNRYKTFALEQGRNVVLRLGVDF